MKSCVSNCDVKTLIFHTCDTHAHGELFLSTGFLTICERHEFQTLHANRMRQEIDGCPSFFFLIFGIFLKKREIPYFSLTIFHAEAAE